MTVRKCPICHKYTMSDHHVCDPQWETLIQDTAPTGEDEANINLIRARDAEDAAESAARDWETYQCDYGNSELTAWVRSTHIASDGQPSTPWTKFVVECYSAREYHAH